MPLKAVQQAIDGGLDFVLRGQHADGRFIDWALPPGPSSAWSTAYVGLAIAELPEAGRQRGAAAIRGAAHWLLAHPAAGGGWGYNDTVGADANSTAFALRLLARTGLSIAAEHIGRLLSFQHRDGGFSTYGGEDGIGAWGQSHADVSAACASVLAMPGSTAAPAALRCCLAYIAAQRGPDGLWPSFWWRSPWYATHAALSLLKAAGVLPRPLEASCIRSVTGGKWP